MRCANSTNKYDNCGAPNGCGCNDTSDASMPFHMRCHSETTKRGTFVFPPPPRLCKSVVSSCCDSDSSDVRLEVKINRRQFKRKFKRLPPIGVFWDIENCQVPKGRSALAVTSMIRNLFYEGYREAVFLVVCDVKKENAQVIQDLNDAQVSLIHVASVSKNAADEKLRQELRRYAETHPPPAAAVLISSDINFAPDLSDLRYRKKMYVILVHNANTADALILCANETYSYSKLMDNLPKDVKPIIQNPTPQHIELQITNLPMGLDLGKIRNRLKQLSDNCGGRVTNIFSDTGVATIKFSSMDTALRAQRRMDGEDVFGNKIIAVEPALLSRTSPLKNISGRKIKVEDSYNNPQISPPLEMGGAYGPLDLTSSSSYNNNHHQSSAVKIVGTGPFEFKYYQQPQCRLQSAEGRKIKGTGQMLDSIATFKCDEDPFSVSPNERNETMFQPVSSTSRSPSFSPVDLNVSNIDCALDPADIRTILVNMFKEHVRVQNAKIFRQTDGSLNGIIRVGSVSDAQYAISQLHHHKLGKRRISISYGTKHNQNDPQLLRMQAMKLLQEVPGYYLPLFKFLTLLEKRVGNSVSVSEVNKLKDVCKIIDETGARNVLLNQELRRPSPNHSMQPHNQGYTQELTFCTVHCPTGLVGHGWAEHDLPVLPNVYFHLRDFTARLQTLLHNHMGMLPLQTFGDCFYAEFHELLPIDDDNGVSLEHFVTRVKNVALRSTANNTAKYICWAEAVPASETNGSSNDCDSASVSSSKCSSPPMVGSINLLGRELVDLLRKAPRCQLSFNKFIPAYHHHFGRQCRVADYGYTKLVELMDALPHIVQIIGEGNKKIITLSRQAQVRRFTSDLLRILKMQPCKQLMGSQYPTAYEKQLGRPFVPLEYGLCHLEDLINEVNKTTVAILSYEDDFQVAIPKRGQTAEEIKRTKAFKTEVVELLRHAPNCAIIFNKFVPAYHHHFGWQCKVSDYGFTKLIELFEAIPETVRINSLTPMQSQEERLVTLTQPLMLKVFEEQIAKIMIKESQLPWISLSSLPRVFLKEFGYALKPQVYECDTLEQLLDMTDGLQVDDNASVGPVIVMVDADAKLKLEMRVWSCLVTPPHSKTMRRFAVDYRTKFGRGCGVDRLRNMPNVVEIFDSDTDETVVTLVAFYVLVARIYRFLYEIGGNVNLTNFESLYARRCGHELRPSDYGASGVADLLQRMPSVVVLKGRRKKSVTLNRNLIDLKIPLPVGLISRVDNSEAAVLQWPPEPSYRLFGNDLWGVVPPKPDTPPAYSTSPWTTNLWNSPVYQNSSANFSIPMPPVPTTMVSNTEEMSGLVSPTRSLIPAHGHPLSNNCVPHVMAPKPSELPRPNDLLMGLNEEQNSVIDFESAAERNKRKIRLAPQFNVQMS